MKLLFLEEIYLQQQLNKMSMFVNVIAIKLINFEKGTAHFVTYLEFNL